MNGGILEVAQLHIDTARLAEFTAAAEGTLDIVAGAPGCRSIRLLHCVEDESKPILLVRWDRVEDHLDFRESPAFAEYRARLSGYFIVAPTASHYTIAAEHSGPPESGDRRDPG